MKKLCYISYDCFLDVDYPVVRELNKKFRVYWMVFIKFCPEQRYCLQEVADYAAKYDILLELSKITSRYRSFSHLIESIRFTRRLKKTNADIFYFQEFTDPYIPVFTKLFLKNNKVVVSIHDVINHKRDNSLFRRVSKFLYTHSFSNYHIFSETQKEIFLRRHRKKNILLAPLCLKDFGPSARSGISGRTNFLFFGAIEYYKGLDILIEAGNLLASDFNNFTIVIAGFCRDFSGYMRNIRYPACFNLIIKIIPNNEIAKLFVNSDYLVQPYRDVTQSGSLKIALNYLVPVIASDLPGFREDILEGSTGFLFEPDNYLSLYHVMRNAVNQSDENRTVMKRNIKTYIEENLNTEQIVNKYVNYFEKMS